jgi:hypothetical protein
MDLICEVMPIRLLSLLNFLFSLLFQCAPYVPNLLILHLCICLQFVCTRNVDVQDYKFFSIGTVELPDGRVLHLVGMLGSWWIYRVSFVK